MEAYLVYVWCCPCGWRCVIGPCQDFRRVAHHRERHGLPRPAGQWRKFTVHAASSTLASG